MEKLTLRTSDNYDLAVTLFRTETPNNKIVIINSATGVKQETYYSFAKYLVTLGFTVLTYDYYGINQSKPKDLSKCSASMRTWGSVDYKAVTQYVKANYPSYRKFLIGHSVGSLLLGMNEDSKMFEKIVFNGTQKAYITNLSLKYQFLALIGFAIAQPISTLLLGYFPSEFFGLGESVPTRVSADWKTLILNKKSTNRLYELLPINYCKELRQPTLVMCAEDDPWITEKGVKALLAETYPNIDANIRIVKVSESDSDEIGHINYFRKYNQKVWDIIPNFFNQ